MDTVKSAAKYVCEFEPVFLHLYAKNHDLSRSQSLKAAKQKLEQSKKRILELDKLIKENEVFDSVIIDVKEHVPIKVHFTAVGIIDIPDEKELLSAMDELREKPAKTA